jgi:hypothetical protein
VVSLAAAEWWKPGTDIIQAVTAAVVAGFGAIQLWRERRRDAERQRAAEARIGATTFLARRTLAGWLTGDEKRGEVDHLEGWLRGNEHDGALQREFRELERRLEELVVLSVDSSPPVAASVQRAYVYVLSGISRLTLYVSRGRTKGDTLFDQLQLRNDAVADLEAGMEALRANPMHEDLLRFHGSLQAKRKSENPFRQLAEALAREFGGRAE